MKNKGFTLVELMVTITIMLIMTATVLFNYNKFNESSLLNAFAYDLSLTIRQAQVYGGAVREGVEASQGSDIETDYADSLSFSGAYGVHLTKTGDFPLKLYVDANENGEYDNEDVVIQSYKFQRGIRIVGLCANTNPGNPGTCDYEGQILDITFKRPDPEAIILIGDVVATGFARITLENADQDIRKSVVVELTGQISVQ